MAKYELYEPSQSRYRHPVSMERCRVAVWPERQFTTSQCGRKATVFHEGIGYCSQHSPQATAKRNEAREARWAEEQRRQNRKYQRPADYQVALIAIANGANDPRSLARKTLEKWNDIDPE